MAGLGPSIHGGSRRSHPTRGRDLRGRDHPQGWNDLPGWRGFCGMMEKSGEQPGETRRDVKTWKASHSILLSLSFLRYKMRGLDSMASEFSFSSKSTLLWPKIQFGNQLRICGTQLLLRKSLVGLTPYMVRTFCWLLDESWLIYRQGEKAINETCKVLQAIFKKLSNPWELFCGFIILYSWMWTYKRASFWIFGTCNECTLCLSWIL